MTSFSDTLRAARRVKDPCIRAERVQSLGEFDHPRVLDALVRFLGPGETSMVRTAAAKALGRAGGALATAPLVDALADPWYDVRCQAAKALARLGDRRAADPLNRHLLEETDGYAIAAFVEALGPLGDASSAGPLLAHVARYPRRVETALVEIGQPVVETLIRTLEGGAAVARQASVSALGQIGDRRAIEPLCKLLARSHDTTLLSAAALSLHSLGWENKTSRSHLLTLIATGQWDDLVRIGRPAVRLLAHALRHQDSEVRCGAAQALGEIGNLDAVPALLRCFQTWAQLDGWTRQAVARALGQLGDPRAVEPLLAFVADTGTGLRHPRRQVEMETIAQIGDPRAIQPLIEVALSGGSSQRREEALHALRAWRDPRIVEALRRLLSDVDLTVRKGAAEGLARQGWQPASPEETAALLIAGQRWGVLVERGRGMLSALVGALEDELPGVQQEIVRLLGRIGDVKAAEPVLVWLFAHPVQIQDKVDCQAWIDDLHPLFGDFAALIVHVACYAEREIHVLRDDMSVTEHEYVYDLEAGNRAIHTLSAFESVVATNLFFLVADKRDATVDVHMMENEWGGGTSQGMRSFAVQREMARQSLQRRPGARYDPSAYEVRANWVLPA